MICLLLLIAAVIIPTSDAFTCTQRSDCRRGALFMGRAAAVRAATKAKTDGAKAKNNGRYAKKIITAVRAGGPDPEQNRLLAQVMAEAQRKNVPKDIIKRNIDKASEQK
jgi:ribosomal protein L17